MLTISNYAVLISAFFTALASTAVYVLSKAAERDKDRAFETYRLDASRQIATANEGAEQARAEAERAKLETAKIGERLALTQERLDNANLIVPFTAQQVDQILHDMTNLQLGETKLLAVAANDHQAQQRLLQLTTAFAAADRRLYTQTTGSLVAPVTERGDILIHYWSDNQRGMADAVTSIFRRAGLVANIYKLPPESEEEMRDFTHNMVLIGFAARPPKTYSERR